MIAPMPSLLQVQANAGCRLRIDGEGIATAALARQAERVEAPALVAVARSESGDLCPT